MIEYSGPKQVFRLVCKKTGEILTARNEVTDTDHISGNLVVSKIPSYNDGSSVHLFAERQVECGGCPDGIAIHQSVGRKDSFGNDIFFGDIVSADGDAFVVEWFDEQALVLLLCITPGPDLNTHYKKNVIHYLFDAEPTVVLGNIHMPEEKIKKLVDRCKSEYEAKND